MAYDPYRSTDFSLTIPQRIDAYLRCLAYADDYEGFETHPLQQVQFLSHSTQLKQLIYLLVVPSSLCNKDSNLHGGAASTLLDNLSSTSLFTIAKPGFWDNMGVSRSLYIVYHRAIPQGSRVNVVCTVAAVGRKMATVRAELRRVEDGALCASCVHEKFSVENNSHL